MNMYSMYNTSNSSPGKMLQSVPFTDTMSDVDKRRCDMLDTSMNGKFASSNQQERVHNIKPFVWILRHVGFEFVQVLEFV